MGEWKLFLNLYISYTDPMLFDKVEEHFSTKNMNKRSIIQENRYALMEYNILLYH